MTTLNVGDRIYDPMTKQLLGVILASFDPKDEPELIEPDMRSRWDADDPGWEEDDILLIVACIDMGGDGGPRTALSRPAS